jgi:hypothetical protein
VALNLHSGKLKGKHLLAAWILHQILNAEARQAGRSGITTVLVGQRKERSAKARKPEKPLDSGRLRFLPKDATESAWAAIGTALRHSWQRPLPIFPELIAACWDWEKNEDYNYETLAEHLEAWRLGAEEDSRESNELATPKAWTRLIWRGIDNPVQDWKSQFLDPLWIPAVRAAGIVAVEIA